jgi:uncharacterized protein (DUF58 family)
MAVGLGMAFYEIRTGFVQGRLGIAGRTVVLTCGVFFSVWGLKEVIAGLWPSLTRSRIGRHRFAIPVEGQIYLVIMFVLFIGSMLGRSNPLILVFSLMAGPFVVNGWLTFTLLKRLKVSRKLPPRVMAGELTSVEICLENEKWWLSAWLMQVIDEIADSKERLRPAVLFARVPPKGKRHASYQVQLMQRGAWRLGPIQINTRFPLGLVERGLILDVSDRILVYPRIGRLRSSWESRLRHAAQLASVKLPRGGTFDEEFHKLRDYRRGDDLRTVHWKTSARRNELMVREFQESREQNLIVLLDAWQPASAKPPDVDAAELAISLAASVIADERRRASESAPFFAAQGRGAFEWGGSSGPHRMEGLLDGLALLEASPVDDLSQVLDACLPQFTYRHQILLITSRPRASEKLVEQWAAQDPASRARVAHAVEIISSRDPRSQELVAWA